MTPADRAYRSARAQGLPATVEDPTALLRLARIFRAPVAPARDVVRADGPASSRPTASDGEGRPASAGAGPT